jgi:hypothetical protein
MENIFQGAQGQFIPKNDGRQCRPVNLAACA